MTSGSRGRQPPPAVRADAAHDLPRAARPPPHVAMFVRLAAGHPDVVELRPRGPPDLAGVQPALAREVMVDNGRSVTKGEGMRMVTVVLGNGILTIDGSRLAQAETGG